MELGQGKAERRSVCLCACASVCLRGEYRHVSVCIHRCFHVRVFGCIRDSVSTGEHLRASVPWCVHRGPSLRIRAFPCRSVSVFKCVGLHACLQTCPGVRRCLRMHVVSRPATSLHTQRACRRARSLPGRWWCVGNCKLGPYGCVWVCDFV